jgi:two-component system, cell cycle response regulator
MSLKALVADDNILNIRLLRDILIDENFEVYMADNGLPVVEMARELLPDVILLDIMMPGLDGFRVCELLKNTPDVKDIPVIMVTAKTDGNDIRQALDIGAFDYIRKPFDEIEVVARIYSAIRYREQQNKLLEFATKDSLTGLFNRAILMELFEKELSRQERCGSDIAFVMMDMDHFKQINDTYGHVAGDTLLKEFTGILAGSVRQSDIIGRYGGDEFSLILSRLDSDNILLFCERIRKIIEQSKFLIGGDTISVTTSMGICVKRPDQDITAEDMIQNADAALYRAKNNGRNRAEMTQSVS